MAQIRFGPSGNDVKFYEDGNKASIEAPKWLAGLGLSAYEISFGLGLRMTDKTAEIIGKEAQKYDIQISVHAPYYINLANNDKTAIDKSYDYIKRSLHLLHLMGGRRLVMHIGSQMDMERQEALENCRKNLCEILHRLDTEGIDEFFLCIETMGKYRQIGNVEEICDLCGVDERVIPTFDFGHINCLMQGEMNISQIFDLAEAKIGKEKLKNIHIHVSFIEFSKAGEVRHVTLDNKKWSFDFTLIFNEIIRRGLTPTIICESTDIMAQDAVRMMKIYQRM